MQVTISYNTKLIVTWTWVDKDRNILEPVARLQKWDPKHVGQVTELLNFQALAFDASGG